MQYIVLLRRHPLGTYVAVSPAVPDCKGEGKTRDEALRRLKTALEDWLIETEITTIEVAMPAPGDGQGWHPERRPELVEGPVEGLNPWLMTAGIFADDPMLEPMLREIYIARDAERPVEKRNSGNEQSAGFRPGAGAAYRGLEPVVPFGGAEEPRSRGHVGMGSKRKTI